MHIPSQDTTQLALLCFQEALEKSLCPCEEYDVSQWLYVPNFYSEYRYILGTRGSKPLICVGINPSTAAPNSLDNTLKSVERIAKYNGYDSFIMFNVYAQRATNPDHMEPCCNPELHRQNMEAFRYILGISQTPPAIWAAWGTIIEARPYLPACVKEMISIGNSFQANWFTAGKRSKKGHPHHPLYLKKDTPLDAFDIAPYIDSLSTK